MCAPTLDPSSQGQTDSRPTYATRATEMLVRSLLDEKIRQSARMCQRSRSLFKQTYSTGRDGVLHQGDSIACRQDGNEAPVDLAHGLLLEGLVIGDVEVAAAGRAIVLATDELGGLIVVDLGLLELAVHS